MSCVEEWSEEIRSKKEFGTRLWENLNAINILVLFFWQVGIMRFLSCGVENAVGRGSDLVALYDNE